MDALDLNLPSLSATEQLGRALGSLLKPGQVVALVGPLGAGKTHLSRAIAEGLGVTNPAIVTSPTFTLVHEYPGRLPIYHFDAYRLNNATEFLELGSDEYFAGDGVCLVEWADRVPEAMPADHLRIELTPLSADTRRARLTAQGPQSQATLLAIAGQHSAS